MGLVAGDADAAEQVVGVDEAIEAGKRRIGFDQVLVLRIAVELEQTLLPCGQAEARQGQWVNRLLTQVWSQLRIELRQGLGGRIDRGRGDSIGASGDRFAWADRAIHHLLSAGGIDLAGALNDGQ